MGKIDNTIFSFQLLSNTDGGMHNNNTEIHTTI